VTVIVCGVLLAAGGGSRFTGATHKLHATLHGVPVWQLALRNLLDAHIGELIVVTGAAELPLPTAVTAVHNPHWKRGQATSLQAARALAEERDADALVVGLADQPFVPPEAWQRVAAAPRDQPLVVASYDGVRGPNPVRLHRSIWPLLPETGDNGARDLIRIHPEWVLDVACPGSPADIDTVEDLDRWKN
jgi:molybdenum cofactor cytidylyltransferase